MKPDSGEISIFGGPMCEDSKNHIGYLPEERGLYKKLSVSELIMYLATLKGMDKSEAKKKSEELLRRTGMLESRGSKIRELSKGMSQMIQFIITIIHDPKLLILDEPFSGLDPVNTELMKAIIGELRDEGKAIIFSTHQMNQVEELCDRVLMIHKGSKVLYGDLKEVKGKFRTHSVLLNTDEEIGDLPGVLEMKPGKECIELVLTPDASPRDILDQLRERNLTINRFELKTPSLHEIFLKIAGVNHE
jgi:ABC-2 type transport system ATP-binding protein